MKLATAPLTQTLREARLTKGWSQRDLSHKAGLPQAHISRIEGGAVDPRLSTLQELARLLDLEVLLVPRLAIPSVESAILAIEIGRESGKTIRAAMQLNQLARDLGASHPDEPLVERLAELAPSPEITGLLFDLPDGPTELQAIASEVQAAVKEADPRLNRLRRAVNRLAALRNRFGHDRWESERPAYSLDDED